MKSEKEIRESFELVIDILNKEKEITDDFLEGVENTLGWLLGEMDDPLKDYV